MADGDVQDQVNAILVESADDDRHSDSKKGDDTKGDDKQNDEKQDTGNDDGDDNNEQPGSGASDEQPGFGIVVALIALLAAAGFALRRQ